MKIVLLTSMRTGSTWLTNQLSVKHDLTNHNEYFHDYVPRTELFKRITNCIENDNWIVKLFPLHLQEKRGLDILNVLLSNDAELRFLFRKDLKQQVYSLACAKFSHKYNKDRDKKVMPGWHDIRDFKVDDSYRIEAQNVYNDSFDFVRNELKTLIKLYKQNKHLHPKVYYLEDLPNTGKYQRKIEIPVTEYDIDIDIAKELKS